jgi:DNA/RNA-binding domain of Phe-tRNA-synthetase-like protein
MDLQLTVAEDVRDLAAGVVVVRGARIDESDSALREHCDATVRRVLAAGADGGDARRAAVRQLLRHGGFKPSGRNKPAQEYLLRAATQEGRLPAISNVVDVINAVSLSSGLPISLLSLDRVGANILIRYGRPEERFVFNQAGQQLDVRGLLCLCAVERESSRPVGSPVKDSMAGKVDQQDRNLLACIYAPASAVSAADLEGYCQQLSDGFTLWCGAESCRVRLAPAGETSTPAAPRAPTDGNPPNKENTS